MYRRHGKNIIIIMDQLSLRFRNGQLSQIFQQNYRKMKQFIIIVQNKQLIILLASFLDISDILNLAVANKEIYKIIQNNPNIQNRVLRAQVDYLTHQQERKTQYNKLNSKKSSSAYSLFETYFDNMPTSVNLKIPKIYSGQTFISNLPAIFFFRKFSKNSKPLKKSQQVTAPKQVATQNIQKVPQKKPESDQLSWYISNDREYQLITKWKDLAAQKQKQQLKKKIQKFKQLSTQQRRKLALNYQKLKEQKQKQKYIQINPPDQSLIIGKQTLWDRLKNKFLNNSV